MRYIRLTLLLCGLAATLSAANPFVGVWKLNVAKSDYKEGLPPKEQIVTITETGPDTRIRVDGIQGDGTKTVVDYTIPTAGGTGKMQTSDAYDGITARMFGPNSREINRLKNGKVVFSAVGTVSADGKTITAVSKGVSPHGKPVTANLYYDRVK
jgi:hypothetical protein